MAKRPKRPPRFVVPSDPSGQISKESVKRGNELLRAERDAKKGATYGYARFFRVGKNKWRVIPRGERRSRAWKGKPPGNTYRDRIGVLRFVKTGRPVPKPKLSPRPKGESEGAKRFQMHLETATGLRWRRQYIGSEGYWRSRFRFKVHESEGGVGAPFGDVSVALDMIARDSKLLRLVGVNRASRVAVVGRPEEGSRRDEREFSISARAEMASAITEAEETLIELEQNYEESPWEIVEVLWWLK